MAVRSRRKSAGRDDSPTHARQSPNSVWALTECTKGLKARSLSPWAASFYLRWINHLMGDVHQPLHNIAQYSKDYPDGQVSFRILCAPVAVLML